MWYCRVMRADHQVEEAWTRAHGQLSLTSEPSVLEQVVDAWSQEGRHYHGSTHLRRGLETLKELGCTAGLATLVWFFHDAVYVVGQPDNEARSARWFCDYAKAQGLDAPSTRRGAELILMTADHQGAVTDDPLWPILNDVDLAIFAADRAIYDQYAEDVWREYKPIVPRKDFAVGRAAFMAAFAARPIFLTETMKLKEAIAHANIEAEVMRLRVEAGLHG